MSVSSEWGAETQGPLGSIQFVRGSTPHALIMVSPNSLGPLTSSRMQAILLFVRGIQILEKSVRVPSLSKMMSLQPIFRPLMETYFVKIEPFQWIGGIERGHHLNRMPSPLNSLMASSYVFLNSSSGLMVWMS